MGVSISELNGHAPSSVTLDPDGNVLSVTVTEARFKPGEVDVLLASRREESVPRGDHGLPLSVAMDPANQFAKWKVQSRPDFAQIALSKEQKLYAKKYPDVDPSTVRWMVEKAD